MSYFKSDKNETIFILLLMTLMGILIQGWFINYIDFIGVQDTGLLNLAKRMVSSYEIFTDAENELLKHYENMSPLYPIICGLIYYIIGDIDVAFKICYILFSGVLICSIFLISLRLYGKETAVISSLLTIFLPAVSITIYMAMKHVIFISLLYLSLYFILIAYLNNKTKYYVLSGISLGFLWLARGEGVIIFLAILIVFILTSFFEDKRINKNIFKNNVIFALSFLLLYLPYILIIYKSTENWGVGGDKKYSYETFVGGQGFVDKIKANEVIQYGIKIYGSGEENNYSILNAIRKKPRAYIHRIINNGKELLVQLPSPTVLPFYLLPFIGIALIELLQYDNLGKANIIFMTIIASFIMMIIFVFNIIPRYLTPIVPIMIIWSAYGIKKIQDTLRKNNFNKFVYLPSIIIILSLSIMFFAYTKTIAAALPRETKAIGEWIKSNTSASDLVIVPKEWFDERFYLQYYSKRKVRNDSSISVGSILILKEDQINMYDKKIVTTELNTFIIKDKKIVVYGMTE